VVFFMPAVCGLSGLPSEACGDGLEFAVQRMKRRAGTLVVGIAEYTAGAVAVVVPAGVVEKRIPAQAFNCYATLLCQLQLLGDVAQPGHSVAVFGAGFRQ